jgi:class 3 adenylate cyclase/tetratricopeptide (TPR) repeat protein
VSITVTCDACGTHDAGTGKFCVDCGARIARRCPTCGASADRGRFCAECGTPLAGEQPVEPAPLGTAERRVCSVLFADLVGFTTVSEGRDVEDVRELLSRYFDLAKSVIARHGGVIEKFIGDAVMAVWGAPVAGADDAERAVRAGLELVSAVGSLDGELTATNLTARAGVVTAEMAVTVGAVGQGMVAGDPVNTAARIQSSAEPGVVLVDDRTRALSRDVIDYLDAGELTLKGKSLGVHAWRATQVVAGVGGGDRVDGLEASFVGRERELRLVKEHLHAVLDGDGARLVAISGDAGIGKSRLVWEFEKYVDGLATDVLWHRGQCVSYGDGVAFWALAQIVRQRCGIAEGEAADAARTKLHETVTRYVADEHEREFVQVRLAALLGLGQPGLAQPDLFAGWRLFVERLSADAPVLLVIEDAQSADAGLLDFIESLLDWSASYPICMLTVARPELAERRPQWGSGRRTAVAISLPPLGDTTMSVILDNLVTGLPPRLRDRIVHQAGGNPLFAIETIRSMIDRDLVIPRDGRYTAAKQLAGEAELEVPPTLTSVLGARIDALPDSERTLVRALAVLGGSFTHDAIPAVSALAPEALTNNVNALLRKEILSVRADRLSPDRGQYTFVQPLLRQVAYETLSRRNRVTLHRTVAEYLRSLFADDGAEVSEVIAAHYRDAHALAADQEASRELRELAVTYYMQAGDRAKQVGAPITAASAYLAAAELATDEVQVTTLRGLAGIATFEAGRPGAVALLKETVDTLRQLDRIRDTAQFEFALGTAIPDEGGQLQEVIDRVGGLLAELDDGSPDPDVCALTVRLARSLVWTGREDEAAPLLDRALRDAQALVLTRELSMGLDTRALILSNQNRIVEAMINSDAAVAVAESAGLLREQMIAEVNRAALYSDAQDPRATERSAAAAELARRLGDSVGKSIALGNINVNLLNAGRWAELTLVAEQVGDRDEHNRHYMMDIALGHVAAHQGRDTSEHRRQIEAGLAEATDDANTQVVLRTALAEMDLGEGRLEQAYEHAIAAYECAAPHGILRAGPSLGAAAHAALRTGRVDDAERLVVVLEDCLPGHLTPLLRAQRAHLRARVDASRGRHEQCDALFRQAIDILEQIDYVPDLAYVHFAYAEWLVDTGRPGDAAAQLHLAVEMFDRLSAAPALARAQGLLARCSTSTSAN